MRIERSIGSAFVIAAAFIITAIIMKKHKKPSFLCRGFVLCFINDLPGGLLNGYKMICTLNAARNYLVNL